MDKIYHRVRLQQKIIDRQNDRIKELEERNQRLSTALEESRGVHFLNKKLKSATWWQRVFNWRGMCNE